MKHLTLSDLEGQYEGHPDSKDISHKAAELCHMLLLNANRKSYMGSPISVSHLTLSDLERSKLRCRK